ncbi:VWA domain-containing protein [Alistipes indistinctus]|nr:hypothetical protein AI2BBH_16140 [Alistipes indistinctus]
MEEPTSLYGRTVSKAEAVAATVNMLLGELLHRSRREEGYRDYFDIAVLGYHGERVEPLLSKGKRLVVKPSELYERDTPRRQVQRERRLPDGRTLFSVVEQREWIAPFAEGQTPMYAALLHAYELVRDWCAVRDHRECYPPAIFNITDGEASDSDEEGLSELAARIRGTGTDDGNALLMNIHISSDLTKTPVVFAASEEELPEQRYARLLYRMSSVMPPLYNENITALRGCAPGTFRGVSYNASMTDLIGMMNIGSVSVTLMD